MTASRRQDESGFTMLELMITCLIMTVVVAIAGGVLYSVSVAANRNDAVVSNQQRASNVITQLSRDIRSAASLSFPTSSPSTQVELQDNLVSGSSVTTTPVLWLYTTTSSTCRAAGLTAPCLLREVQVSGTFTPQANLSISLANNVATKPVLTYYTFTSPSTALNTTDMSEYTTCTTTIGIDLVVSSTTNNATSTFEETGQVALTNQVNTLTAPGNGQCR